jgi:threonyl-tRNA synthetase
MFRVTVDDRDETVARRIRQAHDDRVPYMIIVGDDEKTADTISVRDRFEEQLQDVSPHEFRQHLLNEIEQKRTEPDFLG